MVGQVKAVVGTLAVGLLLYSVGSVIALALGDDEINRLYMEYMVFIWFVLAAASYPLVRRLLKDEGKKQ